MSQDPKRGKKGRKTPFGQIRQTDYMPDADFILAFDYTTKGSESLAPAVPTITLQIETKIPIKPDANAQGGSQSLVDAIHDALADMSTTGRAKLYILLANNGMASSINDGVGTAVLQAACGLLAQGDAAALATAETRAGG